MKLYWIITILIATNIGHCNCEKDKTKPIDDLLAQCCVGGENLAEAEEECSNFRPPDVEAEFLSTCFFTSEICCSAKLRNEQCKKGVLRAKEGKDCHSPTNDTGHDFYKNCCESCKIGLYLGTTQESCKLEHFVYGKPFDDSLEYCCNDVKSGEEFVLTDDKDLCGSFDRLCSQICENTDDSYVCKCLPYFQLQDDRVTCLPINGTVSTEGNSENEVLPTSSDECQAGYSKNEQTGECVDIDECENGDVTCNIETQVCFNTVGSYQCLNVLPVTCPDGYRKDSKTKQCVDINECLEQSHNCNNKTQLCINSSGGFHCYTKPNIIVRCAPGFQYDEKTTRCRDINECETPLGRKTCGRLKECVNTPGGYECIEKKRPITPPPNPLSCTKGFKQYLDKCVDIDECANDKYACDSNQICINVPGSFQCECKSGFTMDKVVNACVDVNECQINNHDCLESQRCDNTIGSYTCIRLQSCGTGYTLNAGTGYCDDDDECILNRHNCIYPYECRNTKGSFRCDKPRFTTTSTAKTTTTTTAAVTTPRVPFYVPTQVYTQSYGRFSLETTTPNPKIEEWNREFGPCNVGFHRNIQGACSDTDECLTNHSCRRNQRCINTNGSYRCINLLTCSGGYTSNDEGTQCIDIDECELKTANCGPDQICRNKPGGYTCSCPTGHTLNAQRNCEDINECEFYKGNVCPVNAVCVNTIGSYHCDCKDGFKKQNPEDKMCIDIDECQEIAGLCSQRCINYWGSYRCACDSGFRLNANNRTCEDIDECEVHKSYNLCMGICENTPGSYQCTCPAGYRIAVDGRTCQDIDECANDNVCNGRSEICTNVKGGYRCSHITCPQEYTIDPEHKNRCKRISMLCEHGDTACVTKPTSYSYNFITLVSNMSVPPQGRGLFTYKGPNWYDNIDFDLKIVHSQAPLDVKKANEQFFSMHKMRNEALLSLMQSIEGPQDIELELSMTVFKDSQPVGTNVAKLFIIVSEYSF